MRRRRLVKQDIFNELNKPGFRPQFMSEFSMGQQDFERYDLWLRFIERWSGEINAKEVPTLEQCQNYFAGLNVLYKQWRPIISVPKVKEELDEAVKACRLMKRKWENNVSTGMPTSKFEIFKLVDSLDAIHTRLMEIKQVIGLGIVVKKNISTSERIKRGVRGDKNYSDLPEA